MGLPHGSRVFHGLSWARQLARGPAGVLALVVVMLAMVDASSPESAHARAPTRLVAIGDYGIGGPTQMQFGTAVRSFASARSIAMLLTPRRQRLQPQHRVRCELAGEFRMG